ncbi:hypothetical protein VPH35_006713 [Triticum aestivum]
MECLLLVGCLDAAAATVNLLWNDFYLDSGRPCSNGGAFFFCSQSSTKAPSTAIVSESRGQGLHGQPRRIVLASDEWRLFDIDTEEEEDGHGRRRTEHLSSSKFFSLPSLLV